jgi:hypothetical protein
MSKYSSRSQYQISLEPRMRMVDLYLNSSILIVPKEWCTVMIFYRASTTVNHVITRRYTFGDWSSILRCPCSHSFLSHWYQKLFSRESKWPEGETNCTSEYRYLDMLVASCPHCLLFLQAVGLGTGNIYYACTLIVL